MSDNADQDLVAAARIGVVNEFVVQVEALVRESGSLDSFDGVNWIRTWLKQAHPALGGRKPQDLIGTEAGRAVLHNLLASQQSGGYW